MSLPEEEQDAIAFQILDLPADEQAWKAVFAAKRDVIRRMAWGVLAEDDLGQTRALHESLSWNRGPLDSFAGRCWRCRQPCKMTPSVLISLFWKNLRMLVCNLRRSKGRMIFTWCESVLVIGRQEFCGGIGLSGTGSVVTLSTIDLFSLGYAPGYTLAFTVISLAGCRTPRMWRISPLRIGRIRACFHLKPQTGADRVNGRKGEFVSFGGA